MTRLSYAVTTLLLCGVCSCLSIVPKPNPCATTLCAPGYVCRVQTIYCFVAPCPPPIAECRKRIKPGFCPAQKPGLFGICLARCSLDADCSGNFKCCGNCPRTCKAPVRPKIGRCPRINTLPGICIAKCSTHGDCPGRQLCCGSCPRMCRNPVVIWPGRCRNNWDCRGRRRVCCRGRCRRRCRIPWPIWFHMRNDDK